MRLWIKKKVLVPVSDALKNGVSQKRLALSMTLGITLGLIPFYGVSTLLVTAVALSLRLDFIVMQAVHYAVYPIQIALFIPFFKAGNYFLPFNSIDFTLKEYVAQFKNDFWLALNELWKVNLSAIIVWLVISIPLSYILYRVFIYFIRRYAPAPVQKPLCTT